MANEIEEKKVEQSLVERDCFSEAHDYLNRIDPDFNLSNEEGARIMNAYIAGCEGGPKKIISAN